MLTMPYTRRPSTALSLGTLQIGGQAPIVVQSMNNVPVMDVEGNLAQLHRLAALGCELSRIAIPDQAAVKAFARLKERSPLPLVADIHFDWRLAMGALEAGADKLRINPGNIRDKAGLKTLAREAQAAKIPIRVGVNAGSLAPEVIQAFGGINAKALSHSALAACKLLEDEGFDHLCVSLKASSPALTIASYRMIADKLPYPLHVGVTEAGPGAQGLIRSAVGIGSLLAEGIGDTIRVSLTADPEEEIKAAYQILSALELRQRGPNLVACPSCGRTEVALEKTAKLVAEMLKDMQCPLTVAVMGCRVNGPGEAKAADIGLAGGKDAFILFKKGKIVAKLTEEEALERLKEELMAAEAAYLKEGRST